MLARLPLLAGQAHPLLRNPLAPRAGGHRRRRAPLDAARAGNPARRRRAAVHLYEAAVAAAGTACDRDEGRATPRPRARRVHGRTPRQAAQRRRRHLPGHVPNSTDVSDYGEYDTSTIQKDVTAVVDVTFAL